MTSVAALRNRHVGETAYIVGSGPSLLALTADAFGPGPVIALNHAILRVRALGLPNPLLSSQKDGCYPYPSLTPYAERQPCGDCPRYPMVAVQEPEILLTSADESPHCFADYPLRYSFDPVADLDLPRENMSAPVAVRIAQHMGAANLVMLGQDAFTHGDPRTVLDDASVRDDGHSMPGYLQGAEQSNALAEAAGTPIRWVA